MDLTLKGKKAFISGGTHGIGKAIALALADEGCDVAVVSRSGKRVSETVSELQRKGITAIGDIADLTNIGPRDYVINKILENFGDIDILINNVGGGGRWGIPEPEGNDFNIWYEVWKRNTGLTADLTMLFLPGMLEKKWGRVITIASIYGKEAGGRPWFTSAKSASIALMKELSRWQPYARANITFNSICPGYIYIPGTGWDEDLKKNPHLADSLIAGRFGTPEDVANLVVFLCSEKAKYISGSCITVDGGESRSF